MVSEFKWPDSIPSGQRTYKTPSCLIRKTIKIIELETPDGDIIDLLDENNGFDERDRLMFITGAIGAFCGTKNSLYDGFVNASNLNNNTLNDYRDYKIRVIWNSEGKKNIFCDVGILQDVVTKLKIISEFSAN